MIDEMGKYQQEVEKEETFEYIVGKRFVNYTSEK